MQQTWCKNIKSEITGKNGISFIIYVLIKLYCIQVSSSTVFNFQKVGETIVVIQQMLKNFVGFSRKIGERAAFSERRWTRPMFYLQNIA